MEIIRYPYRARAWWGDTVIAESDECIALEELGQPSNLYFPRAAIDLSLFSDPSHTTSIAGIGEMQLLSIDGHEGRDLLSIMVTPADGVATLADHGTFDATRIRLDVMDEAASGDARDSTVKQFPTWGDASHLIDLLDVRPDGDSHFVGAARTDGRRPVVEGSQMLGQTMVAAARHAPNRRITSANMIFLRAADSGRPLCIELEELSSGRTFVGLAASVSQEGRGIAAGTLLLDATAPDLIRHEAEPPDVPGPYECPALDMALTGRDIRVVNGAYTNDPDAPVGPPLLDAWVRFREVPEDPALHVGLLAQFTGHMSIAAALRPHEGIGQAEAHRTLSMGINAISLSLHREPRADQWLLYHHVSTFAGDGMTHSECRVHTEHGDLVASFTVDAMVRAFPESTNPHDERRAL